MSADGEITIELERARQGDQHAMARLWELVYADLKQMATASMRNEPNTASLSPSGLVSETYMRLCPDAGPPPVSSSLELLAWSRTVMRSILIDVARRRNRVKRGGGVRPAPLLMDVGGMERVIEDDVELDDLLRALHDLREVDSEAHDVVWCRFGMAMSIRKTAEAMCKSSSWVERKWEWGRRWLFRALTESGT